MKGFLRKMMVPVLALGLTATVIPADVVWAEPVNKEAYELKVDENGMYQVEIDESRLTYLEPGKAEPWIDGKSIPSTLNDLKPGQKPKEPVEYDPVIAQEAEEWMQLHGVAGDLRGNPMRLDLDSLYVEGWGYPIYAETYWNTETGTTETDCTYYSDEDIEFQDSAKTMEEVAESGRQDVKEDDTAAQDANMTVDTVGEENTDSAIAETTAVQPDVATADSGSGTLIQSGRIEWDSGALSFTHAKGKFHWDGKTVTVTNPEGYTTNVPSGCSITNEKTSVGSGGVFTKYASVTYKCTAVSAVGVGGNYSVTLKVDVNGKTIS